VRLEGGLYNTGRGWIKLAHLPALNGGHHFVPVWPAGISFSPAADKVLSPPAPGPSPAAVKYPPRNLYRVVRSLPCRPRPTPLTC
jgi:hypothetical protein